MYWMITNRDVEVERFGDEFSELSFWTNEKGPVDDFPSWTKASNTDAFKKLLIAAGVPMELPLASQTRNLVGTVLRSSVVLVDDQITST